MSRFIEILVGLLLMLSCVVDILGDLGFHEFPTTIHYAILLFTLGMAQDSCEAKYLNINTNFN